MADTLQKSLILWRNLGKIYYKDGLTIMRKLTRENLASLQDQNRPAVQNTLLLCEHFPVYTTGVRDKNVKDIEYLERLGAEFQFTDRGGLITFHGPGQLMCYPILNLTQFKNSIGWYNRQLEEVGILTCKKFGVIANRTSNPGVWVDDSKIAAIGVYWCKFIDSHRSLCVHTDQHSDQTLNAKFRQNADSQLTYQHCLLTIDCNTVVILKTSEGNFKILDSHSRYSYGMPHPFGKCVLISVEGFHVSRWITSHGLALNCNVDLGWFDHIVPCGLEGKSVTSLSVETWKNVKVNSVIQPFLESFQQVFNCELRQDDSEYANEVENNIKLGF